MWFLTACSDPVTDVHIYGEVFDRPPLEGELAPNSTIVVYEEDGTTEVSHVVADDAAVFATTVPAGVAFVLAATGLDGRTSTFSTTAPTYDFYAGTGVPWVASQAWLDEVDEAWAGCGTDDAGMVIGEVRVPISSADDMQNWPLYEGARVVVTTSDSVEHPACHGNAEGVYDPTLTATSALGTFAVFGAPAGPAFVEISINDDNGETISEIYDVWVAEDGVVGMYPAISPTF